MAEITIEFTGQTRDLNEFGSALFEIEALGSGTQKEIPGGGRLTMQPMIKHKAYGIPQYIEIVLSTGDCVTARIASNYIYSKLRDRQGENLSIRINRRAVQFDKGKITSMIRNELSSKRQ